MAEYWSKFRDGTSHMSILPSLCCIIFCHIFSFQYPKGYHKSSHSGPSKGEHFKEVLKPRFYPLNGDPMGVVAVLKEADGFASQTFT